MISLPDITIVSQIYESANSLVYRGIFNTSRQPVILKLLKEDYPTPAELYRYQQEYEITRSLNLEGIIQAYELRKYQNTLLMLLEDFGGESLKILLQNRSFSVPEFLHQAIQITEILGKVHQNNVIHKDINPSNIVLNPQTRQLKIIDFGLSTLLSQENLSLKSPNVLEGTLAYISPEQTGRMNRALDYRTDFYSLGVTFYELLTNQLPFESVDALELVHCHIAKQPIPHHLLRGEQGSRGAREINQVLSDIVMKLMAKTAEERYQSAWGIKADLETCLTQYKNGAIQRFTLGCQDISHQLQIPEKLYGREPQIESLLTAFERTSLGQTELMLISGYSGIGKSAIVQELYKLIIAKRGYFIKGKFDQLHRDIPYQALVAAFQELVRQLLTETAPQLQQWRKKILAALGANGQIIIDAPKSEQKRIQKKVKANLKNIKKWAHFAPMTHLQKFYLVEAELHRVLGEKTQAIDCYDRAIALAKENDYLNEEALANELTAKFYLDCGKEQVAQAYLTNAYHGYLRWGATAKVKDLEQQYPQLLQRFTKANMSIDSRNSLSNKSGSTNGEVLDLAALMKASQAIASEIELDKLLTTLMRILLSSAGAQTGCLILESLGELRVEASGDANSEQVIVLQSTPIETCLPASIIYYVARTQEGLIESDVAREGRFKRDDYIKTHQPKSILCAPLLNQGQLIGIIYLENNLADSVFTPDRLELIQMLSTQAAIALTNARLYTEVQSTQNRLNKFLNAIPLGISVHDAKGQLVYANQVSQQLLNIQDLPKAETQQLSKAYRIYQANTGQMYPVEQLPLVRSLGGEKTRADDLELHNSEGIVPLEVTSTPIFDETGSVEYAIAAFQDISDRKQAQKTLIKNVRLEQEISARKKTEAELEQAKDTAETANRAKSTFLANMSHELRTPLNAILGFSQLMNQDANLSTAQKENLGIIHRSGEHLLTLINQVLDLSKVEAGRMVLSTNNFNLYYLLANIEDMFALKAKDKGLQLRFDCAFDVPQYICTDEIKLRQVLINLISNAIKFTASGSVLVKVGLRSEMHRDSGEITNNQQPTIITFEVTDTGVGIAADELENLFQPFVQTASGQQVQQGTGLGLTISHQFVRLMGGEITVISRSKALCPPASQTPSGTTFKFDIPVGIADEGEIENQPHSRRVIALAPNQPQYRILVVDDKHYNRQLLVKLLKPVGFEVQEANNGQDAIEIWDSYSPHLIWMDMRMPVMDGYEATKRIKSTIKGQATTVIALTATVWEEEKEVILSAGCDDFVRKPFYKETIFEMMAKHLGVSYIYQEQEPLSHSSDVTVEPLNFTDLLAAMPKLWIIKLHEASLDADAELVLQILESIPESHALIRQSFKDWVKKFQFEKILDLTEPLLGRLGG